MISHKNIKGFSLVELAVVLSIVGLVFYGTMGNFGQFFSSNKVEIAKKKNLNIKKQLMNYAVTNKYLPCPDTDVPPDGVENRNNVVTALGNFERCTNAVGTVPYADIGFELEDVQDGWGNMIRYAVNQGTDNDGVTGPVEICDIREAAAYFCREGDGRYSWFTMQDTPPVASLPADNDNYFICNENTASSNCDGASPITNPERFLMDAAIAVLVAYNEDGSQTLANCGGASALNNENCDLDRYYHQGRLSGVEGQFFDDIVEGISGYELKSSILSNQTFTSTDADDITLAPTYEGYDLNDGDYIPLNSPQNPDVIRVNRNVTTSLDLGNGDDVVVIGNDLQSEIVYDNSEQDTIATVDGVLEDGSNADLEGGNGNDSVYIVNDAYSSVFLGSGDDQLVIGGKVLEFITGNNGEDEVWIQGSVETGAEIDLGLGDDVIWLGVYGMSGSGEINSASDSINAGGNNSNEFDVIIFENLTKSDWDSDNNLQGKFKNFELVIFKDDGSGNREVLEL